MKKNLRPRVAICGIRGIPARYGGFETFAEELSPRLLADGFDVTVYCRPHVVDYRGNEYKGIRLVHIPAIRQKYLETPLHSFCSFVHLLFFPVDVVLVCNAANAPFLWLLRLRGIPVATNVDGIERRRAKWNSLGKLWYRIGEWCAARWSSAVISDADVIHDYYLATYGVDSEVICYGYNEKYSEQSQIKAEGGQIGPNSGESRDGGMKPDAWDKSALEAEFGIRFGQYVLYVSRLEPENNALIAIQAYEQLPDELRAKYPLVVVGDAPYADEYKQKLREVAGKTVIFTGFQFGERYPLLQLGAAAYIQATEVGGTHPALVESMGFANAIIANDTPEHREVLGAAAGVIYEKNNPTSLAHALRSVLESPDHALTLKKAAFQRARERYSWTVVTAQYARLLRRLANRDHFTPINQG